MRPLPTAVLVAALSAPLAITSPASAVPGVFTGSMHINCFGCGSSPATADLTFTPGGPAQGEFQVLAPTGAACTVSWQFEGTIHGSRNANVNVVVLNGVMVITATGDSTIGGVVFVTSPVGVPCGGPVDATLIGWLA